MWWLALAIPAAFAIAILCWNAFASPAAKGVSDGRLGELPDSPNCVSTQTNDTEKRMEPIAVPADAADIIGEVEAILSQMAGVTIVEQSGDYLHAEFVSSICRFVDDVEFYVDENESLLHFRSASRVGYSDLGVNRERMQKIRNRLVSTFSREPVAIN